jgi:redox-sensitive bicupin YhaK (pirin superfamily)
MNLRTVDYVINDLATSDGAGVNLTRSVGKNSASRLDPFLMLDYFASDNPDDYIAGFPPHPHRGFETVTYMVDGTMLHKDHLGNEGLLTSGAVQWMTAGKGVIHEERPQQENGLLRGFQLWVNLPAKNKMEPANYQQIEPEDMTTIDLATGGNIRLVAGSLNVDGNAYQGAVSQVTVNPLYADVTLLAGETVTLPVDQGLSAFVYPFEGTGSVGNTPLVAGANVLSTGDHLSITADDRGVRFLLIAGQAINEPIAQYGPFVMNTQAEVQQAMQDYNDGVLTD